MTGAVEHRRIPSKRPKAAELAQYLVKWPLIGRAMAVSQPASRRGSTGRLEVLAGSANGMSGFPLPRAFSAKAHAFGARSRHATGCMTAPTSSSPSSMALKATIHKARLGLANMDRQVYDDHDVIIARHPSETDERTGDIMLDHTMTLEQLMQKDRVTVRENAPIREAAALLVQGNFHSLPATSRRGKSGQPPGRAAVCRVECPQQNP